MLNVIKMFMIMFTICACSTLVGREEVVQHKLDETVRQIYMYKKGLFQGRATAFILTYSMRTYIITNRHVCERADLLMLGPVPLTTMIVSYDTDLCAIPTIPTTPSLLLADLMVPNGTKVYSLGYGGGVYKQKTGTIKGAERTLGYVGDSTSINLKIIPGDSGSPVVNEEGKVLGVIAERSLNGPDTAYMVSHTNLKSFLDFIVKVGL